MVLLQYLVDFNFRMMWCSKFFFLFFISGLTFGLHLRLLHGLRLVIIFRIFTFPVTNTYLKSRMSLYFGMVQTLASSEINIHES
uniref:cDNA clone:J023007B08, full insert sequence n=1 Tax=Oryza sativa subsp. japonica TaxID=39947 RepID=B7EFV6_ORYSJ|nr:unnamed protein product [Oryza sativa Japonica Group]